MPEFITCRDVLQKVVVDGSGSLIRVMEEHVLRMSRRMVCANCGDAVGRMAEIERKEVLIEGAAADQINHLLTTEPASAEECYIEDEQPFSFTAVFTDGYEMRAKLRGVKYLKGKKSNTPVVEVTLTQNRDEVMQVQGRNLFTSWVLCHNGRVFEADFLADKPAEWDEYPDLDTIIYASIDCTDDRTFCGRMKNGLWFIAGDMLAGCYVLIIDEDPEKAGDDLRSSGWQAAHTVETITDRKIIASLRRRAMQWELLNMPG